jgi:hypothetical protein
MQVSLSEILNLQVLLLLLLLLMLLLLLLLLLLFCVTLQQEDVSQRRYVVKDVEVGDDGRTNDFGALGDA